MKCLVVDDEVFTRELVVSMLDGMAECEEAASGGEALTKFSAALESDTPFDLVLMDIMMPGMNGHETAKAIRSAERGRGGGGQNVKIVMLTALNTVEDAMESFCSAQSAAYIVKPVSREKLHATISKLGLKKK